MTLPDPYPIQPLTGTLSGTVPIPGSKSITNRALILGALSDGPVDLEGALFSRDSQIMIEALRRLGFTLETREAESRIRIAGQAGRIPAREATLQGGNSGTSTRFLAAMVTLHKGGRYRFEGDPEMEKRPMRGLLDSLVEAGWADVEYHRTPGCVPFTLKTYGISGGSVDVDPSESSQMLSALLLACTRADAAVCIRSGDRPYRQAYVELTSGVVAAFGGCIDKGSSTSETRVQPGLQLPAESRYRIEPDASSASYFFAAPLVVAGSLRLTGFSTFPGLQGDTQFLEVLEASGLQYRADGQAIEVSGEGRFARACNRNFYEFSDTFLTYAALSPLFPHPVTLSGLAHTRKQETDRVAGMARELEKLGMQVVETEDSLELTPKLPALKQLAQMHRPLMIETYKDHRFAMSFAILGLTDLLEDGKPWLAIRDPLCCSKTFPDFFQQLETLRQSTQSITP